MAEINQLLLTDWIALASAAIMALSAAATVMNLRRNRREDVRASAELLARICKDIEYIRLELTKLEELPHEIVELRASGEYQRREIEELKSRTV